MFGTSYYRSKYIRTIPNAFCTGCGNGMVLNALLRSIDVLSYPIEDYVFVSGIGCAAWIPSPNIKADTVHTLHGRAIPVATGIKLGNPELKVIVVSGDGDLGSIGGNHLIHAARNNVGITVIMCNNQIYGMTGGQVSASTPHDLTTSTTPYGNTGYPFDYANLVKSAGATYVARWTTAHLQRLIYSIKKGIQKNGFSFIEVLTQCPTYFAKSAKLTSGTAFLEHYKRVTSMDDDTKIRIGEFVDIEREEFASLLYNKIQKLKK